MRNRKEEQSLKKRMLIFIVLCWVVPIGVFFFFTTISYRDSIITKTEALIEGELENVTSYASIRIDEAISLCQKPSYEKVWEKEWKKYKKGDIDRTECLQSINGSLRGKFYLDGRFHMYAFYLYGEDAPGCYSSRQGKTYGSYIERIEPDVKKIMDQNSSYTYLRVIDGRLFIIRNLFTTDRYKRFGSLVVELNVDKIFSGIPETMKENLLVYVDNSEERLSLIDSVQTNPSEEKLIEKVEGAYDTKSRTELAKAFASGYRAYLFQRSYDDYHLGVVYWVRQSVVYASLYEIYYVAGFMLLLFIPLVIYGVHFIRKQIQNPISQMMEASRKMEEGQIGIRIAGKPMPNAEFGYLEDSFNSMSSQVKYLFDYAYDEKLARKDAQIQALQAQINPHFLNNTLEMMNWQARMSGDSVISKMIESLGTVLNYRMNRANVKEIHLAEELQCTDAYLYIMSMRFGQRLHIEKEVDESLLHIFVPPLILQPIVENAIVHGVERVNNGVILMKIYHDETRVLLQVRNSGKEMTESDELRIRAILNGEDADLPKNQGRHTSIGIRNVNQRIKLMYGEEYGLTIVGDEKGMTVSTILIPFCSNIHQEQRKDAEINKIQQDLQQHQKHKTDKGQE